MSNFSLTIDPSVRKPFIEAAGGEYNGVFSFKSKTLTSEESARGKSFTQIFPFSSSLKDFINNDSGMKSIGKNNYAKFLNDVPALQFRAYYPNTVLNEIFSLLGKLGFSGSLADFSIEGIENFFKDAVYILKGLARPNASKSVAENVVSKASGALDFGSHDGVNFNDPAIIQLPYALYYKLVSTQTNAAYEIPCQIPSGFFDSDGNYGWGSGEDIDLFNAGGFMKKIASTFHLTMMPFFSPGNGGETETINVKLDLLNDSENAARANYAFIQTLILNNKWMQYGVTQIPGSLYDVRIPGGQRFFMCTGSFKVSYKGILRSVGELGDGFKPYKEKTMIPDAYSLDLTFKSLLPSNLNNYLFGIAKQKDNILRGSGEEPGLFTEIAEGLFDALKGIGEMEKILEGIADNSELKSEINDILGKDLYKSSVSNFKASNAALKAYQEAKKNGMPDEEALKEAKKEFDDSIIGDVLQSEEAKEKIQMFIKSEDQIIPNLNVAEKYAGETYENMVKADENNRSSEMDIKKSAYSWKYNDVRRSLEGQFNLYTWGNSDPTIDWGN